ncbi:acyl carrier protein phosphodiesterase [Chamaesiphon sp. GL140_3_metabinner_50]|uniref:acyl carrier protein phosphodiesterase n=1 Tax=Chamaesiphon sp. GL140_3_metabinner_50 TaxID=2970812 RepID=UPI0025FD966E|nr:acyl carrier protein phosphodiesterase [Chamaesiphon sp. GL140_3_metabinner_50]
MSFHRKRHSATIFADFTVEIYESFQTYSGEIPSSARQIIGYLVDGDWLSSYQHLAGVENALDRIDYRIRARMGDRIKLVDAMPILERESIDLERDFHSFFPELQQHIQGWTITR